MGGRVDHSVNKGGGPYTFRLNGQNLHRMGSLIPPPGRRSSFAQLYVHDTDHDVTNRMRGFSKEDGSPLLDVNIMRQLVDMLDVHNVLVQSFCHARDTFQSNPSKELTLRLIGDRLSDGRQYNLPSCSKVADLMVRDAGNEEMHRDIFVHHNREGLQCITSLHPSFMALQYTLLFPYGEDDFRLGISHRNPQNGRLYKKSRVAMRQYYGYHIQQRQHEGQTLLHSGRLFQQYVVDAHTSIEENRLNWIRNNKKILRAELYICLRDALNTDLMSDQIGRLTVLPSSHTCEC